MKKELLIILGNQLFPINKLKTIGCDNIFMAEDIGLCTYIKHHKQKIAFFLTAMRDYRDELSANQYNVFYQEIDENTYTELKNAMPSSISWELLSNYEKEDNTKGSGELACTANSCEVVDI